MTNQLSEQAGKVTWEEAVGAPKKLPKYADCGYVGLTRDPQHKCDKCKPLILASESEALVRAARAEAFEDAQRCVFPGTEEWLNIQALKTAARAEGGDCEG